jgi:hypothetical protein
MMAQPMAAQKLLIQLLILDYIYFNKDEKAYAPLPIEGQLKHMLL